MSRLQLSGVIPSPPVIYTDDTCREIDYEGYRRHLQHLLAHDITALCIGGHAGETECLTMDERLKVIDIAIEESKGRVPVIGGVIADSTHSAIDQAMVQKERGVDAVLVCPPQHHRLGPERADAMHLAHFGAFDRAAQIPFMIYGGPGDARAIDSFRKPSGNSPSSANTWSRGDSGAWRRHRPEFLCRMRVGTQRGR